MIWVQNGKLRFVTSIMFFILTLQACAGRDLPHINESIQRSYNESIAIRPLPYEPDAVESPSIVKGAARGASKVAAEGTVQWIDACMGTEIFILHCLAVTPVVTVIGAVVGAGASHSAEEVTSATTSIKNALVQATPTQGVTHAIAKKLREAELASQKSRILSESELNFSNLELSSIGFDAVLDIEVTMLDLVVLGALDPDAEVELGVKVHLHDTRDPRPSLPLSLTYRSIRLGFFEMAKNDAILLRETLNQSYEKMAALVVEDLFLASN